MRAKLPPQRQVSGETAGHRAVVRPVNGPAALLALQRAAGNGAVAGALSGRPSTRRLVVQRDAGVEFETGIQARDATHQQAVPMSGWVPQDEVIWTAPGWEVQSDNSKLEFVTSPPVGMAALDGVVTSMLDAIEGAHWPAPGAAPAPLANVLPAGAEQGGPWVVLSPPANRQRMSLTGTPQGTVGIPYARLPAFFRLLESYELGASKELLREHGAKIGRLRTAAAALAPGTAARTSADQKVTTAVAGIKSEAEQGQRAISASTATKNAETGAKAKAVVTGLAAQVRTDPAVQAGQGLAKLQGLLELIGQYAREVIREDQTGYKKKNVDVMTRTSFHAMYAALPGPLKPEFRGAAEALMGQLGIGLTAVAFPHSASRFTIGAWLDSIVDPLDRTIPTNANPQTWQDYRTMTSDLMTAPGAADVGTGKENSNTDKSMGSMGLDNGLVVVELRQLHHFTELGASFSPTAMRKLVADLAALGAA